VKLSIPFLSLFLCFSVNLAQAALVEGLKNESEAGIVIVSGNAETETYNFKQASSYLWQELNTLKFDGRYLNGYSNDVETARSWAAALRYERGLTSVFSVFAGQGIESNVFAGIRQNYITDAGLKYWLIKSELTQLSTEAGYRYTNEYRVASGPAELHYGRVFTELNHKFNESASLKLSAEYLPNFTENEDYQINGEAAVFSVLSSVFSLKTGYLARYRNVLIGSATERLDTTFSTALVAKF